MHAAMATIASCSGVMACVVLLALAVASALLPACRGGTAGDCYYLLSSFIPAPFNAYIIPCAQSFLAASICNLYINYSAHPAFRHSNELAALAEQSLLASIHSSLPSDHCCAPVDAIGQAVVHAVIVQEAKSASTECPLFTPVSPCFRLIVITVIVHDVSSIPCVATCLNKRPGEIHWNIHSTTITGMSSRDFPNAISLLLACRDW